MATLIGHTRQGELREMDTLVRQALCSVLYIRLSLAITYDELLQYGQCEVLVSWSHHTAATGALGEDVEGPMQALISGSADNSLIVWLVHPDNASEPWRIAAKLQACP